MGVATLPDETQEEEGAPVEEGAEATRTAVHLFAYSRFIHLGEGAEECAHREDGECRDPSHFHAWVRLPNNLQRADILDKARAAKARRKRALTTPDTDAYVILESELDDLLSQDKAPILRELAEREVRKDAVERLRGLIENTEKFNNYWQDMEELERLKGLPEEERPTEEFESLQALSDEFDETAERQTEEMTAREVTYMESLKEEDIRSKCRLARIDGDIAEVHMRSYYLWMGFVCTNIPLRSGASRRVFEKLDDYRNASPEVVSEIQDTLRDLEQRLSRGDAAGN